MGLSPIIFITLGAADLKFLRLTASPQVTIQSVKLTKDHMTVTWLYKAQSLRHKSASTNVAVVIFYQSNGGEESRYPPEGSLAADEQQATIHGQFDLDIKYDVWLKVYEGQLVVSKTASVEAQVKKPGSCVKCLYSCTV